MAFPSLPDFDNGKKDLDHIDAVATSTAMTATDRKGQTKPTLNAAIYSLMAFNNRGAWAASTAYAIKDLVLQGGVYYVAVVPHTSAASFATDQATKWRVYQGVTTGDLGSASSGGGSDMVRVVDPIAPAYLKTVSDIMNGGEVNIARFYSSADFTALLADARTGGTPTIDCATRLQTAITAMGDSNRRAKLRLPYGRFRWNSGVVVPSSSFLVGDGQWDRATEIYFYGANGENCISSPGGTTELSRFSLRDIGIRDKRTGATSGSGLRLNNVDNGTHIIDVLVSGFPTAQIYVGSNDINNASDCVFIQRVWVANANTGHTAPMGIHLQRLDNNATLDQIYADIQHGRAVVVDSIGNDNAVVNIRQLKHEANNSGYDAGYASIWVGANHGNLEIDGVVQRNALGAACDILVVEDAVGSRILARNIAAPSAQFGTHATAPAAPYTVRVVAPYSRTYNGRVDEMVFFPGGSSRRLGFTSTPESAIYGNVGDECTNATNGRKYWKRTGNGTNTGWWTEDGYAQTVAYASAIQPNYAAGNLVNVGTLTGNITVNLISNGSDGDRVSIRFTQDATGGRIVNWNASYKNATSGTSGTAGQKLLVTFERSGSEWVQTSSTGWYS